VGFSRKARSAALAASVAGSCIWLAGCMGAPTYGTDKPSDVQLLDDVSNIVPIGSLQDKKPPIKYAPRAPLVKPASTDVLPPPQNDIANANNPNWPESPEERRRNVRLAADLNKSSGSYDPHVAPDTGKPTAVRRTAGDPVPYDQSADEGNPSGWKPRAGSGQPSEVVVRTKGDPIVMGDFKSSKEQSAEFKRRMAENMQGSATERKYLSEPPLTYREPAASAPVGELGKPEWKKERDAKKAAQIKRKNDWWPF
jgi:hypothetical protein